MIPRRILIGPFATNIVRQSMKDQELARANPEQQMIILRDDLSDEIAEFALWKAVLNIYSNLYGHQYFLDSEQVCNLFAVMMTDLCDMSHSPSLVWTKFMKKKGFLTALFPGHISVYGMSYQVLLKAADQIPKDSDGTNRWGYFNSLSQSIMVIDDHTSVFQLFVLWHELFHVFADRHCWFPEDVGVEANAPIPVSVEQVAQSLSYDIARFITDNMEWV